MGLPPGRRKPPNLANLTGFSAESEAVEVGIEEMRRAVQDFGRVWEHMTLDEQRELLRAVVESLRVWKDRAELKVHYVPALITQPLFVPPPDGLVPTLVRLLTPSGPVLVPEPPEQA
jgi:hypothetical protein